jgi:two-component system, cell cycle response regulator
MDVSPSRRKVPRVLVVDDAREVRRMFAEFLGRSGMHVTEAPGGRAALDALRREKPDVVVTDITMPEMDGLELCRRIRAQVATSDLPIVIVSGDASAEGMAAWEAGCDAVLQKPCSRALLIATVRRLLGTRDIGSGEFLPRETRARTGRQ